MTPEQLKNDIKVVHRKYGRYYRVTECNSVQKNPDGEWDDSVSYAPLYPNKFSQFTRNRQSFLEEFDVVEQEPPQLQYAGTRVFRSHTTDEDLSKTYVRTYSDRTVVEQFVLTKTPHDYFKYSILRKFKDYYLIYKDEIHSNKTWITITDCILKTLKES